MVVLTGLVYIANDSHLLPTGQQDMFHTEQFSSRPHSFQTCNVLAVVSSIHQGEENEETRPKWSEVSWSGKSFVLSSWV